MTQSARTRCSNATVQTWVVIGFTPEVICDIVHILACSQVDRSDLVADPQLIMISMIHYLRQGTAHFEKSVCFLR
jgi:hypothetical protein